MTSLAPRSRLGLGLALLLLLAGLLLRLVMLQQPGNSDDLSYFQVAAGETPVNPAAPDLRAMRTVFLLPVTALIHLLPGQPLAAYYGAIALYATLSGLALFLFARRASGMTAALLALLLWCVSPIYIQTEGRLLPDHLGAALALFGLTLLLRPPASLALGMAAGVLLGAACSVRETFLLQVAAAVAIVLCTPGRGRLLAGLLLGGLAIQAAELLYWGLTLGEPLIRWTHLFAYQGEVKGNAAFQGMTLGGLLLRYPRALLNTGTGEIFLFIGGLAGAALWGAQAAGRLAVADRRLALAKLLILFFTLGLVTVGVVSLLPLVPALRTGLRYYLTALPLVYVGCADLLLALLGWLPNQPLARYALWSGAGLLVLFNLWTGLQAKELVRNGNDAYFAAAEAIRRQAAHHPELPRALLLQGGAERIMKLLLPEGEGWLHRAAEQPPLPAGFVVQDWRRLDFDLHVNGFGERQAHVDEPLAGKEAPDQAHLLFRHQHGGYLTDVLWHGPRPPQRQPRGHWSWDGQAWQARSIPLQAPLTVTLNEAPLPLLHIEPDSAPRLLRVEGDLNSLQPAPTLLPALRLAIANGRQWDEMGRVHADQQKRTGVWWAILPPTAQRVGLRLQGEFQPLQLTRLEVKLFSAEPLELSAWAGVVPR